jgi:hypothetical protein
MQIYDTTGGASVRSGEEGVKSTMVQVRCGYTRSFDQMARVPRGFGNDRDVRRRGGMKANVLSFGRFAGPVNRSTH